MIRLKLDSSEVETLLNALDAMPKYLKWTALIKLEEKLNAFYNDFK